MTHDPTPTEVRAAARHLSSRMDSPVARFSRTDRAALQILLVYVALTTAQGRTSPS